MSRSQPGSSHSAEVIRVVVLGSLKSIGVWATSKSLRHWNSSNDATPVASSCANAMTVCGWPDATRSNCHSDVAAGRGSWASSSRGSR